MRYNKVMSTEEQFNKPFYTYSDYKNWPDDERWEIIEGEAFQMSPAPGTKHQEMVVEMTRQIANFLEGKDCSVFSGPVDVFLPARGESEDETSTVVQPDLAVVCDKSKITERGIKGPPDIMIEVLSPYGRKRDLLYKLHAYEKTGVREYWIVHDFDRILYRYTQVDGGTGAAYGRPNLYNVSSEKLTSPILPGFKLDLLKVFGPEPEIVSEPSPAGLNRGNNS